MPHRHHPQSPSAQKNHLVLVFSSERIPILDHIGAETHAIKYACKNNKIEFEIPPNTTFQC
jgi:hypothetical protein